MAPGPHVDEIARLLGDPSRAAILSALMDGRQWTGRELADIAHVTPSTASLHLKRLIDGNVIAAVAHGRHKYYRISRPDVGRALETLMTLAPAPEPRHAKMMDADLRRLRTCYDHLAGNVAVALCDALVARGALVLADEAASVTAAGTAFFASLGIEVDTATGHRPLCRPCLDWSERRYHVAGRVGVAIARFALENDWVSRRPDSRALVIAARGEFAFREAFGIDARRSDQREAGAGVRATSG